MRRCNLWRSSRVVGNSRGLLLFGDHDVTVNRSIFRLLAATIVAAMLFAAMPAPASAQGLFDFLFGNARRSAPPPTVPSYADPSDPQRADPGERGSSVGGPAVAYCVRTCDGHFFPIQRNANVSPVETCQSFCPSAQTKIYTGSGIAGAVSHDGKRYSDLPNAFAYRDKVVSNCSCNGKTAFGLANVDVKSDPTLRPGDIVATHEGLAQVRGSRRGGGEFTPISKSALMADKRLSAIEGCAAPTNRSASTRLDQLFSRLTTSCAIDSELVSPGDSIPNRCTSPAMPCCAGPSIMKSAAG